MEGRSDHIVEATMHRHRDRQSSPPPAQGRFGKRRWPIMSLDPQRRQAARIRI